MNRAAALALLSFVVLITLVGAWFLATRDSDESSESITRGARDEPSADAPLVGDDDPQGATRAGAVDETATPTGLVLHGRVELQPGAPDDEQLSAALLRRWVRYRSFAGGEDVSAYDADTRVKFDELVLARTPVAASGAFSFDWPADQDELYVIVRGRYHYLPESRRVTLTNISEPVVLRPDLGAWVLGHVRSADGAGVDMREDTIACRPTVGAESPDRRVQVRLGVRGDETGAFELRGLPVVQPYTVSAEPAEHAPGQADLSGLRPGERRVFELVLKRGGTVRGFVVDGSGQAIGGARVEALLRGRVLGFDDRDVRDVTSAADGSFEITGTPVGECLVRARSSGYLDSEKRSLDVPEGGVVENVMLSLERGASLRGRVTWADGSAAAGARVLVGMDPSSLQGPAALGARRGGKSSAHADAEGHFEVTGLGGGPFLVTCAHAPAEAAPDDDQARHRAERAGVKPGADLLQLVLQAPLAIAGTATDALGHPIAAFHVVAKPADLGMLETLLSREDDLSFDDPDNLFGLRLPSIAQENVEDEQGRFVLYGLQPGGWSVRAEADGWVMHEPLLVDLAAGAVRPDVTLVLQATAAVSGVVLDPERRPVAGASIRPGTGGVLESLDENAPRAVSDVDGTFRIEGLDPGSAHLHVVADGFARTTSQVLELPSGGELDEVEIILSLGGTITGEVYDADGDSARGEMIAATYGAQFRTINTQSDGAGRFSFENVEPGSWQVIAMNTSPPAGGGETGLAELVGGMRMGSCEVVEGETAHVVLGAPPKDPVRVVGRVTHADRPTSDALLSFYPEGDNPFERLELANLAEDGSYAVTVDGSGAYVISVQYIGATAGQQQTIEFARDVPDDVEEHRIDLELPVGRLSGRVFGPDGEPAAAQRVSLKRAGGARSDTLLGGGSNELQTDGEGRFDIGFLRPGTYRLSAGGAPLIGLGSDKAGFGRVTRAGIELDEGEWKDDQDMHLPRPGSLAVRALDESGAGVGGATVFVRDAQGLPVESLSFRATDAGGACAYPGLAPGDYTVFVRGGVLCSPESGAVTVNGGETTNVELALVQGVVVRVALLDKETGEATRASVTVHDEAGREVSGIYGLQDLQALYSRSSFSPTEYRVGPLPPGRYRVSATTPAGLSARKFVELKAGAPERKLSLRLKD